MGDAKGLLVWLRGCSSVGDVWSDACGAEF